MTFEQWCNLPGQRFESEHERIVAWSAWNNAQAAEREACAKLVETEDFSCDPRFTFEQIAAAIRARGNQAGTLIADEDARDDPMAISDKLQASNPAGLFNLARPISPEGHENQPFDLVDFNKLADDIWKRP